MKQLPLFSRQLPADEDPNNHQRKFLYLPLPIFRKFTNIEAIVINKYKEERGKSPPSFVLEKRIKHIHDNLSQLIKWEELGLNELEFLPSPDGKTIEASVWLEDTKKQQKIHRKLSDHEKQFTYLPLHILIQSTNIRDLLRKYAKGREKKVDFVVSEIHKKLASKRGHWLPELKTDLRFVIGEDENEDENPKTNEEQSNERTLTNKGTSAESVSLRSRESAKSVASKETDTEPIASTLRGPQIVRTPKEQAQPYKQVTENSGRSVEKRKNDSPLSSRKSVETPERTDRSNEQNKLFAVREYFCDYFDGRPTELVEQTSVVGW